MNDSTVRDLKRGPLTLLTGDRINKRFLLRKCMVVLQGQEKVSVITT